MILLSHILRDLHCYSDEALIIIIIGRRIILLFIQKEALQSHMYYKLFTLHQ